MSLQQSTTPASTPVQDGFRLTFTQGFLAGQLSVVIIALVAIRYIIFEDSRSPSSKGQTGRVKAGSHSDRTRKGRKSVSNKEKLGHGSSDIANVMGDIMGKVHYEVDSHVGESIDWVNVIIAQALAGYREDILAGGWSAEKKSSDAQVTAREWMENILNARTVGKGMNFLDPIQVTDVTFGDAYPIFTNAKVRPADDSGRMRVEVDVDYSDCISLSINTKLIINFPRPRFAVLPISLGLTIERFSGTLAIELFSSEDSSFLPTSRLASTPRSRHELHLSLHPDFALDATATSLVGSRAKLQDVPKIEQLLVDRLRSFVHDRFVWPKYWSLTLPNLVPRSASTEAGKSEDIAGQMEVAGQGNEVEEYHNGETNRSTAPFDGDKNGFFEQAPPLFPPINQSYSRHVEPTPSLPGSLPAVEAWRSHAAATGVNHQSRSGPPRAGLESARQRFGTSTASSNAYS